MSTISLFKSIGNRHGVCRGKDCIKNFCEPLREHAMKITNFKKNKMKFLTKEQGESYENEKICYTCKEQFKIKYVRDKKYCKVGHSCHCKWEYKGSVHSICNLKHSVP